MRHKLTLFKPLKVTLCITAAQRVHPELSQGPSRVEYQESLSGTIVATHKGPENLLWI